MVSKDKNLPEHKKQRLVEDRENIIKYGNLKLHHK